MRLILTILICILSLDTSAQLFAGYGATISFRERQWVANFSKNVEAGYFIKKTEKFNFGFAAVYEEHKFNGRLFDESIQQSNYTSIEEYGLTPALMLGRNIDSHLSVGIMGGYEFLLYEKRWSETFRPYNLYDLREAKLKNGRVVLNVYSQINIFPRHWISPMLFARYGLLIGNGKPVNEIAMTFCLLYQHKPTRRHH